MSNANPTEPESQSEKLPENVSNAPSTSPKANKVTIGTQTNFTEVSSQTPPETEKNTLDFDMMKLLDKPKQMSETEIDDIISESLSSFEASKQKTKRDRSSSNELIKTKKVPKKKP